MSTHAEACTAHGHNRGRYVFRGYENLWSVVNDGNYRWTWIFRCVMDVYCVEIRRKDRVGSDFLERLLCATSRLLNVKFVNEINVYLKLNWVVPNFSLSLYPLLWFINFGPNLEWGHLHFLLSLFLSLFFSDEIYIHSWNGLSSTFLSLSLYPSLWVINLGPKPE